MLCLGDSYTVGEGVAKDDRWPEQLAKALRKQNIEISDPVLVARSGWTTDDLLAQIENKEASEPFDLVTILIGANDQFRGRNTDFFRTDLSLIIQKAINFTGDATDKILILSIPDWGRSPYGRNSNAEKIALDIDRHNKIIQGLAKRYGINYLDITELTRSGSGPSLYADDGLHPSEKMYRSWVVMILPHVIGMLEQ